MKNDIKIDINYEEKYPKKIEVPDEYVCRVSGFLMNNPVIASDGESYEEEIIKEHIKKNKDKINNGNIARLYIEEIKPEYFLNKFAKKEIEKFLKGNKVMKENEFINAIKEGAIENYIQHTYLEEYLLLEDDEKNNLLLTATINKKIYSIKFLINQCGMDINSKNRKQESVLHLACQGNFNKEIIEYLLIQQKINLKALDSKNETSFEKLIRHYFWNKNDIKSLINQFLENSETASFILKNKNSDNQTILHYVFIIDNETPEQAKNILEYYKKYNIDIKEITKGEESFLHLAIHKNQIKIFYTEQPPKNGTFENRRAFTICQLNNTSLVLYYTNTELVVTKVEDKIFSNLSPFLYRLRNHMKDKSHLNLNEKAADYFQELLSSIQFEQEKPYSIDYLKLLLEEGLDINSKDQNRDTPLHKAAKIGAHPEVIKFLIDHGSDITALNNKKETPAQVSKNSKIREFIESNSYKSLIKKSEENEEKIKFLEKDKKYFEENNKKLESNLNIFKHELEEEKKKVKELEEKIKLLEKENILFKENLNKREEDKKTIEEENEFLKSKISLVKNQLIWNENTPKKNAIFPLFLHEEEIIFKN